MLKVGIKQYFEKYKYQITELHDFMACFQQAAKDMNVTLDLEKWMESWL